MRTKTFKAAPIKNQSNGERPFILAIPAATSPQRMAVYDVDLVSSHFQFPPDNGTRRHQEAAAVVTAESEVSFEQKFP